MAVEEVLHWIRAKLYPNYLGKGGPYLARSKADAPLSIEDICAAAKTRGGFTGQYDDLVKHTHIFVNEMLYQLLDGFSVQIDDLFSLHTRLGGTYTSERDPIDSSNITLSFRELIRPKKLLAKIKVKNEGLAGDGAYIDEVLDTYSGTCNSVLTPGGILRVIGHKIKVEGDDPDCGVWFEAVADGTRTKATGNMGANHANEVVTLIPPLAAGAYKLLIVTRFTHGTPLKEPRTIEAEPELKVLPKGS